LKYTPLVYLLFVCSGLSGLIYQVVWVRVFGNVLGNTIHSASLVIAVFMLGLGAGGYAVGRWADRRHARHPESLLRVFGTFELTIGILALGLSLVVPRLVDVSALFSSYAQGPDGWNVLSTSSHLARAALVVFLLTPITLLMGGTLTLLIRHVVGRDIHVGGWRIALLYAANTAGAAVGCFLTDFALVPAFGLQRTQFIAFAFNVVAALGAFWVGRHAVRLKPDTTTDSKAPRDHKSVRSVRLQPDPSLQPAIGWTAAAIAISGFAAMGMEIIWFRYFSILLGEYRAVFSVLLAIVLAGIGLGALASGWLHRRLEQPATVLMLVQGAFVASILLGLVSVDARQLRDAAAGHDAATDWARAWAELWFNARPILLVAGVPSLLMGFSFPLANAHIQRTESRVGGRAGLLYLANTAGAVGGSLAAGFLLLPVLGIQSSTTLLAMTAAAAIVPLYLGSRADVESPTSAGTARIHRPVQPERFTPRPAGRNPSTGSGVHRASSRGKGPRDVALAGSLAVAGAALGGWMLLPSNSLISRALLFPIERAYAISEGLTEVVAVTDGPDGGRVLVTNGHPMSSTELFSQRYMRAMAHIPLLSLDRPQRVLVLCFGVGNTAHAATLHPTVRRVDVVDLSRHILQHSGYFTDFNHDVLHDPRVSVYINDGRDHLRLEAPGAYDLITLEPPPIVHAGVSALYSREFYTSARSRLTPGGQISQWLPVFGVPNSIILSMIRAFIDVFPNAVLLSGANTNLLLVGSRDSPNQINPERIAAALSQAPAVQDDLRRLDLGTLREIVGTFVASARTLEAATRDSMPVTDDRPIQEYGKRSLIDFGEGGISRSIVAVNEVGAWCPGCFTGGKPSSQVAGLDTYLALTEIAYRSQPSDDGRVADATKGRTVAGSGYLGAIVPESAEVQQLLNAASEPAGQEKEDASARYAAATTLLESGKFADAVDQFRGVIQLAPESVQARNNLGVALASLGRLDEAIEQFQQALTLDPTFEDARRNLALARSKRLQTSQR
jgi:spermidine synthase/MFS family permease